MNDHPIPQDHPIRTVTPETCYKHITADGSDYYPYFDFTLPTADDNDDSIDFEQWLESMFERGVPE